MTILSPIIETPTPSDRCVRKILPRRLFATLIVALGLAAASSESFAQKTTCQDRCDSVTLNTTKGYGALPANTGTSNTAIGAYTLFLNTSGIQNTATGIDALRSNTSGTNNSAFGSFSMYNNTTGSYNTAAGNAAISNNTTGSNNTGVGFDALDGITANPVLTGSGNVAVGELALGGTSGAASYNTAVGGETLEYATGNYNVAVGYQALLHSTTGTNNTAIGSSSMASTTSGSNNTANGYNALAANISGSNNAAVGMSALANTTGSNNIGLGNDAGLSLTTGSNNLDIANAGVAGESNTIRIGTQGAQTATYLAGIYITPISGGQTVMVTSNGQLGTKASSARFKEAIHPMGNKSDVLFALQPVSFRYKKALDPQSQPQFGLIAEEVAKVSPDLVFRDEQGKPFSVRYDEVNSMLLNEFLKDHQTIAADRALHEKQAAAIAKLEAEIAGLTISLHRVDEQAGEARSEVVSSN